MGLMDKLRNARQENAELKVIREKASVEGRTAGLEERKRLVAERARKEAYQKAVATPTSMRERLARAGAGASNVLSTMQKVGNEAQKYQKRLEAIIGVPTQFLSEDAPKKKEKKEKKKRARKMEEGMFDVPKLDLEDVFGEKKKRKSS